MDLCLWKLKNGTKCEILDKLGFMNSGEEMGKWGRQTWRSDGGDHLWVDGSDERKWNKGGKELYGAQWEIRGRREESDLKRVT
jgi:hypothetical protein